MSIRFLKLTTALAIVFATPALQSFADVPSGMTAAISEQSIHNAGRNIMRTADGGIVATYASVNGNRAELTFSRTLDNGQTWMPVSFSEVTGNVGQAAVDSNFKGSYIVFTEEVNGTLISRMAFTGAPFAENPEFIVSDSVSPVGVIPQDVYVQASRKGWGQLSDISRETVAYGYKDAVTGDLYVGVSFDGETFPVAQKVLADPYAASGPAVAVRGNYVVASYQTTHPDIVPSDVPVSMRADRTYPAWIESMDGGKTWSTPRPVFGDMSNDFPVAEVASKTGEIEYLRLAAGTDLPNSPTLNWGSSRSSTSGGGRDYVDLRTRGTDERANPLLNPEETSPGVQMASVKDNENGLTFVQTSMLPMGVDEPGSEVSIVSFREIEPGAPWTHVVAHNVLTADPTAVDRTTSTLDVDATQFQYSALIDTKIRATSYKEMDPSSGEARLVVAVSTDTGMTFSHHTSFSAAELEARGITDFDAAGIFTSSQCLFEDRDGEVYVDLMVSQGGEMRFVSLPTGVNAAELREEEHAALITE